MEPTALSFHHIGLKYTDLETSLRFYRSLGLTEIVRWGEPGKEIVMLALSDGGRIELLPNGGDEFSAKGKWLHFAMKTENVDGMYERALAAGAQPITPPKTVPLASTPNPMSIRIAFVKGPDGEELEFFKEV